VNLDWEGDPELQAIRKNFIDSLEDRKRHLMECLLAWDPTHLDQVQAVQDVAHKLAGTSGSYGFPILGRVGELLDEWADRWKLWPDGLSGREVGDLLVFCLEKAQRNQEDASILNESLVLELISFVESTPVEAKP